jgi:hypothetical protein
MNQNKKISGHSPIDMAVFGVLNSALFGFLLSISLFNRRYEPSKFKFFKKIEFIGRNMLAISAMHGLNQYMINYFRIEENKKSLKKISGLSKEKELNLITCFISIIFPTYLAYKIYYFRNDFILIEKKYFLMGGIILFVFEYLNSIKPKHKYN